MKMLNSCEHHRGLLDSLNTVTTPYKDLPPLWHFFVTQIRATSHGEKRSPGCEQVCDIRVC